MPNKHFAYPLAVAVALAGLVPAAASAQSQELQRRLAAAKQVECKFSVLATGTWDGAAPKAAAGTATLEIKFTEINVDEGTAEADTGFGAGFISARYTNGYLHFLQMSDAGPLYITTVLASETSKGRFKAVQTRHEFSPAVVPGFTSRPEMYVGDCSVQ